MLIYVPKHSQPKKSNIFLEKHIILTWPHKYQNKKILRSRSMLVIEITGNGNITCSLNEIIAKNNEINGTSNAQDRLCESWRKYVIILFKNVLCNKLPKLNCFTIFY